MKVGIVANPQSGKDMRRIVSDALTFNNFEKLNIIKRILRTALNFTEIEFIFMPDYFGFGRYAKEEFGNKVNVLPFVPEGENDTEKSTEIMRQSGVCCIIVLGGDGTNRLVAKRAENVPIIPISTGTNNAFPKFYEGTTIGLALAAVKKYGEIEERFLDKQKKLEILKNGKVEDIALVDITITNENFMGARAITDVRKIRELFVSYAEPGVIGISSVFAYYMPIKRNSSLWGKCKIGEHGFSLKAPVMPGYANIVKIENMEILTQKDRVYIESYPSVAALDGERTVYIENGNFSICMNPNGPYILNIQKILDEIPLKKFFVI